MDAADENRTTTLAGEQRECQADVSKAEANVGRSEAGIWQVPFEQRKQLPKK
jgi:hypothetical protein